MALPYEYRYWIKCTPFNLYKNDGFKPEYVVNQIADVLLWNVLNILCTRWARRQVKFLYTDTVKLYCSVNWKCGPFHFALQYVYIFMYCVVILQAVIITFCKTFFSLLDTLLDILIKLQFRKMWFVYVMPICHKQ